MKRWQVDRKIALREWRKHHRNHIKLNIDGSGKRIGKDPLQVDCVCDGQIGRFRKKDAWDCGNPKCQLCHSYKFPKREKTRKELLFEADLKGQLQELEQ